MIDQVVEAKDYLSGKNIAKDNLFRICYIMAKYLFENGYDALAVRNELSEWRDKHRVNFMFDINDAIAKAAGTKEPLRSDTNIYVGRNDIEEIVKRFDSRVVRCAALAMLCYSKAASDKHGEFVMPSRWLASWLGVSSRTTYRRAISEMILFGYLTTVDRSNRVSRWRKGNHGDGTIYKLAVPVDNSHDYLLAGNGIWELYKDIFERK